MTKLSSSASTGPRLDAGELQAMTREEVRAFLAGIADAVSAAMPQIEATRYDIVFKEDDSPVTTSDVFLEELVTAHVTQRLPGVTFIGEESYRPGSPIGDGYVAVLDPIDGTENFCSGLKEWGLAFSLWHGGVHLGSMLMLPELGEGLMTGDAIRPIRSRITGFSSSVSPALLQAMGEAGECRMMGCAVYNLYNVIRGAYRRFCNPKGAWIWDLLPGLMLALEHGCEVEVDGEAYDGRFLQPDRKYRIDIRHRYDLHPG
ncbi:inositol monophosphatase family protein [Sphingomonas canadensis]|uniref:Inositol monophosphatase family protein n=1 Tax=Sphingomonas canadensis TaxID=1219257 RepID=A0ABW3H8V4_9SPHN|nr:inositol monophosphatase family protein [Sphingomonas canadensis]MCW3837123.1 hypothetical protein [Sphingomonas canadensis]